MYNSKEKGIIVALDGISHKKALKLANQLKGKVWGFKVNDLLYDKSEIIEELKSLGNLFVDVKLYDIPNTVSNSVRRLSARGADIITVHASGGLEMMQVAKKNAGGSKIIAVTVLTSLLNDSKDEVLRLAQEAIEAQVDGIVCSGLELDSLSNLKGADKLLKVVPGIRPNGRVESDDQSRVVTAKQAFDLGADYIVVGRPITQAEDPLKVLEQMISKM
ncbi:MAG: orotidine-5'-phosphate decarboxylase [Parcubacteria group bacterium]